MDLELDLKRQAATHSPGPSQVVKKSKAPFALLEGAVAAPVGETKDEQAGKRQVGKGRSSDPQAAMLCVVAELSSVNARQTAMLN